MKTTLNKQRKTRKVVVLPAVEDPRMSNIIECARSNRRYLGNGNWAACSEYSKYGE